MPQYEEPSERMTFFSIWLCRAGEGVLIWQHCRIVLHPREEKREVQTNEKRDRGRGRGGEEKKEEEERGRGEKEQLCRKGKRKKRNGREGEGKRNIYAERGIG